MGLISVEDRGDGRRLITIQERRLDAEASETFRQETSELPEHDTYELHLDLSQVDFMDTAGIGALLNLQRRCQERQVPLTLHQPKEAVNSVFRILRLHQLMAIDLLPLE